MTTVVEQVHEREERPLHEIDEVSARIRSSTVGALGSPDRDRAGLGMSAAQNSLRRVMEDPRLVLVAIVSAFALVAVVALFWSLRLRPRARTPGERWLERSRETFGRSRDALEAVVARLTSSIERIER